MLIVANWKAYVGDFEKAKKLFAIGRKFSLNPKNKIVLAPPAPVLGALASKNKTAVAFCSQDVSVTTGGARTGEITAQILASVGTTYAIIGHSERRAAGDTDSVIAEKLSHSIVQGITPILCIGENERDAEGHYLSLVREQLTKAMERLTQKERASVIIAYEPVWAISTNTTEAINANDLTEMVLYIRKILAELLPGKNSSNSIVLYGGSVQENNIRALAANSGIDGFMIGHDSIDPKTFSALVKQLM